MNQSSWVPDVLPGFEQTTLTGLVAPDGPTDVVLIRRRSANASSRAVLYVHGYVDYFFQTHLADFYNDAGMNFYAVDLRRHGRSMRPHQLPNYTGDIDEYIRDVDAAVKVMRDEEGINWLLLNGHSTGGLVAALYAHRGLQRAAVNAIFLNSPFLDLNLPTWQKRGVAPWLVTLGAVFPHMKLPGLSGVYGMSIHSDHHGTWLFDTKWKPIEGFPVYAGWFRAIHRAHSEVAQSLSIQCPVLVMHSKHSAWLKHWSQEAMTADVVLDVADIQRLSMCLGQQVEVRAIQDGIHDLILSKAKPRESVFQHLQDWLNRIGCSHT
jgi:alpha-beta hydrolase superfamily lysophospholipase